MARLRALLPLLLLAAAVAAASPLKEHDEHSTTVVSPQEKPDYPETTPLSTVEKPLPVRTAKSKGEAQLFPKKHLPSAKPRAMEEGRRRSKLKRVLVPVAVFLLLKALTLVPLFLGALGLKAWHALQLGFFSFVISVALAVFQLCRKLAADAAIPQVAAHGPWDSAHSLAYGAHMPA